MHGVDLSGAFDVHANLVKDRGLFLILLARDRREKGDTPHTTVRQAVTCALCKHDGA